MFRFECRTQVESALAYFDLTPATLPYALVGTSLCGAALWLGLALFHA